MASATPESNPPPPSGGTPAGGKPQTPPKTTSEASKQVGQKGLNRFSPTSLLGPLVAGGIGGTADVMQGEDPGKAFTSNIGGAFTSSAIASGIMRLPLPPLIKVPASLAAGFFSFGPVTDMYKNFYKSNTEVLLVYNISFSFNKNAKVR